ncbi:hypothetical protein ID866_4497 [Astraeus odoratus]|nr:hypothetical protein ID866_4497 [Astraeus odoratus]
MTNNSATEWPWPRFPRTGDPSTGIDEKTYDSLVRYTKYASATYHILCPRPLGNTLVGQFTDIITSTHGFVARDDKRKELVVAFRGSKEVSSILIDGSVILVPLRGYGLPLFDSPHVHTGFLLAYQSIARTMLDILGAQIKLYPTYTVAAAGKSRLGAIASIATIAIRNLHPHAHVRLYTIGQPRTGDPAYAALVESVLGTENIYRGFIRSREDGVPTMIPAQLGYQHHATEYWQFTEMPAPEHVKRCEGGEDPNGSASIPTSGINPAHWVYFGQREFLCCCVLCLAV